VAQYKAAIEGGADGVDLSRKPLSGGTAQPDLFSMFHALKGTDYKLALGEDSIVDDHIAELMEANNVAVECLKDYNFPPEARQITTDVIFSPMPGGALTANTLMMRETKTFHLFPKVIENMSECVRRGGFASSVTPVSQFYFQQAYMNTLNQAAGRGTWFKMTEGYGKMLLGYQGKTPCEPDPELVKIAADQFNMKPFKEAYPGVQCAEEILEPGIPAAKKLLEENGLPVTDETIFITGCLQTKAGNKGIEFLKGNRHIGVPKKDPNAAPAVDTKNMKAGAASTYRIALGNQSWDVQVQTLK
jgi:pyruvate carboxylase subunit B